MKKRNRMPRHLPHLLGLGVIASLAFPSPAAAYIDPGAGSLALQMLLAGALGTAYAVKRFWKRIVTTVRGTRKRP
jgi:precorrin-6B methylase 2